MRYFFCKEKCRVKEILVNASKTKKENKTKPVDKPKRETIVLGPYRNAIKA